MMLLTAYSWNKKGNQQNRKTEAITQLIRNYNRFIKAGLNSESFRQHVPMIVEEVEGFFKNYKKPTGAFDAYHTLGELIICTASRCLMGKEIRASLDDSVAGLYYDLDQGFKPINFIFPNLPLPSYRKRDVARQKMTDLYSSIIARRKAENDFVRYSNCFYLGC